jgi:ATP-dependent RNA helicase RhlE
MSFVSLGLAPELVRAVTELGYSEPTPIQQQAIPYVLSGADLLAGAQTGTGKTAGFVLPMLQRLTTIARPAALRSGPPPVRALILTPTRELAAQVHESVRGYGKYVKVSSAVIFGGVNINPQISALRAGVDILVSTPGRLLDHVQQRTVDLSQVEILVLDEADRMLDMGFIPDVKRVLALLPKQRQSLLYSATFSDEIKALAERMLNQPKSIEVARRNAPAEAVEQSVVMVPKGHKRALLAHLIREKQWFQVLVFTRTKHGANRLAEQLNKENIPAMAIHGNKSQNARTQALKQFKSGELQVLVATDIAARGIDIHELPQVVNFELPNVAEDYVHRIGRTGRAGAAGQALSLVDPSERADLKGIERLIKRDLPVLQVPGFDMASLPVLPDTINAWDHEARPSRGRQGQGRGQGQVQRASAGARGAGSSAGQNTGPHAARGGATASRPAQAARPSTAARSPQPGRAAEPGAYAAAPNAGRPAASAARPANYSPRAANPGASGNGARPSGNAPRPSGMVQRFGTARTAPTGVRTSEGYPLKGR